MASLYPSDTTSPTYADVSTRRCSFWPACCNSEGNAVCGSCSVIWEITFGITGLDYQDPVRKRSANRAVSRLHCAAILFASTMIPPNIFGFQCQEPRHINL